MMETFWYVLLWAACIVGGVWTWLRVLAPWIVRRLEKADPLEARLKRVHPSIRPLIMAALAGSQPHPWLKKEVTVAFNAMNMANAYWLGRKGQKGVVVGATQGGEVGPEQWYLAVWMDGDPIPNPDALIERFELT